MSAMNAALVSRFCSPEWALCFEVRDATGFKGEGRSADAVAVNCYPSRGLEIHGVEVKAHRSDWLRELKNPQKSAAVQKYCDRWWVAVDGPEIVKDGELPSTWGLLERKGNVLRQVREAPRLESKTLDRAFMASMLRNMAKSTQAMLPALMEAERKAMQKDADDQVKYELERRNDRAAEMWKLFEKIKAETGLDLNDWQTRSKIVPAIKFAMAADLVGYGGFNSIVADARKLIEAIDKHGPTYGIASNEKRE